MAMFLALHRVVAEVRGKAEAPGAELLADFSGDAADVADVVRPEFGLAGVFFGHCEEHDWNPSKDILNDDHIVIFIDNIRGFFASNNPAKDAVGTHAVRSILDSGVEPDNRIAAFAGCQRKVA